MLLSALYAETLERYIQFLPSALDGVLRDPRNVQRVLSTARIVPATAIEYFGFEWVLGARSSAVDLALSLSDDGHSWLQGRAQWPQVRRICRRALAEPAFDRRNVWLEWDLARAHASREPSLYVTLDDFHTACASAKAALDALAGPARAQVRRCMDASPKSASRMHLGFMLQRPHPAVRLSILPMAAVEAREFLRSIGRPREACAVFELLAPFTIACDAFSMQLDCTEGRVRLAGCELVFHGTPPERQPECEPRWSALLGMLVTRGLAARHEAEFLLSWPSQRQFEAPLIEKIMVSANVESRGRLLDGMLQTGLQHVKLATRDGVRVLAKAYFGAAFFNG